MSGMNPGDTAWVLVAAAMVLFMTPGLALFYGGMVRSKNVLNMLLMNMWCAAAVPVLWVLFGASLAGSGGGGSFLGNTKNFFLNGLQPTDGSGTNMVMVTTVIFGMTFAVITPALISGAVADRMKFSAWAIFAPVWAMLVYVPVAYWVFGEKGWLKVRGGIDLAGGTPIHVNAGAAALVACIMLGKRKGWPKSPMPPHNMTLVMIGTGILWFGWFGFNAGSAFGANGVAVNAFLNTFISPAAAMLSWLLVERIKDGHFTTLGAASGIVAGLVAITPAAGAVDAKGAIAIGLIAGALCYFAIQLKYRFGYDDALDVVGVHMVGGLSGSLLIGFFATKGTGLADLSALGTEKLEGLFYGGGGKLLFEQIVANGSTIVFSGVMTFLILKVLDLTIGIRVDADDEQQGLDVTQHAETGYVMSETF